MIERTFIEQGQKRVQLEEYLRIELEKAGFTKSEIEKTPLVTRIVVNVTRPGLAIGKSGQNIKQLTETIEKRFGIDNPQIEIREITAPELNACAMANRMKALMERGFSWRSVVYKALRDITGKGAQGVEIVLSGKLAGKGGRKRKQRIAEGYMKKVGEQSKLVDYAKVTAYPKAGAIGVKVRIVRPETAFPDKMRLDDIFAKRDAEKERAAAEKEKAEAKPAATGEGKEKDEAGEKVAGKEEKGRGGEAAEKELGEERKKGEKAAVAGKPKDAKGAGTKKGENAERAEKPKDAGGKKEGKAAGRGTGEERKKKDAGETAGTPGAVKEKGKAKTAGGDRGMATGEKKKTAGAKAAARGAAKEKGKEEKETRKEERNQK